MEYGVFDVGDPFKKYILLVNFKPLIKVELLLHDIDANRLYFNLNVIDSLQLEK